MTSTHKFTAHTLFFLHQQQQQTVVDKQNMKRTLHQTSEERKKPATTTSHKYTQFNTVAWACALYVQQSLNARTTNIINNHLAIKSDAISCTNKKPLYKRREKQHTKTDLNENQQRTISRKPRISLKEAHTKRTTRAHDAIDAFSFFFSFTVDFYKMCIDLKCFCALCDDSCIQCFFFFSL